MSKCGKFNATFTDQSKLIADFRDNSTMGAKFGETQMVSTNDYNDLYNKPQINEVELRGNKTFDDLGDHTLTNIEIKEIFNRIFNGGN